MKQLIVNADDFGLCESVNLGIIEAHRRGIVRSATLMANGAGYRQAVEQAAHNPGLGVGAHLTITAGSPLVKGLKTLVDSGDKFFAKQALLQRLHSLDPAELEAEFTAQIERLQADGIRVTHMDSHHHIHCWPEILPVFLGLARRYRLPVRLLKREQRLPEFADVPCPDRFIGNFHGEDVTTQHFASLLSHQPDHTLIELMCHPGLPDAALAGVTSYHRGRAVELRVLTDPGVRDYIWRHGVQLVDYKYFLTAGEKKFE